MRTVPPSVQTSLLEADHQKFVVNYLRSRPEHVPFTAPCNGALTTRNARAHAYALGMQLGVPDLLVFAARRGFHGLAVEMKAPVRARGTSEAQEAYHRALELEGWCVRVCRTAQEAINLCEWYLGVDALEDEGTVSV